MKTRGIVAENGHKNRSTLGVSCRSGIFGYLYMNEIMVVRTVLPFWYKHIKEVPTAMTVSFITLWSLWAFLLLVLFLKSAFAHQAEVVFRRDYRTM